MALDFENIFGYLDDYFAFERTMQGLFSRRRRRTENYLRRRRLGNMLRTRQELRNTIQNDNIQGNFGVDGNWGMRTWFGENRARLYGQTFRLYARHIDEDGNSRYIQVRFENFRMADIYNDWTTRASSDNEYDFREATIVFGDTRQRRPERIIRQVFREGISNCLLTPILEDFEKRMESCKSKTSKRNYEKKIKTCKLLIRKYTNGVPQDKLVDICEKLKISINIFQPIFNKQLLEVSPNRVKSENKYTFYNTKPNHVDCVGGVSICRREPIELEKDELDRLYVKTKNNTRKKYYIVKKHRGNVYALDTLKKSYRIKNPIKDKFNKWCKENNICVNLNCHSDHWLSNFLFRGDYTNGAISFNPDYKGKFEHIDMEKAYTQGKSNPYYMGYLKRIYEFRKTKKEMGVGIYLIHNLETEGNIKVLNKYIRIYRKKMILSSPELKYLRDEGCSFDIVAGCWGEVGDIEFPEYTFEKFENVPLYSRFIGLLHCSGENKSISIRNFAGFEKLLDSQIGNMCSHIDKLDDEIHLYYRYNRGNHATQIPIFIQAYQRIRVLQQLSEMNVDKVIAVATDGIFYKDHKFNILKPFRYEKKEKIYHGKCASYIPYVNPYDYTKWLSNCDEWTGLNETYKLDAVYDDDHNLIKEERENPNAYSKLNNCVSESWGRVEYWKGAGGTGKTHTACHNNKYGTNFIRLAYFAPSNKLKRNKNLDYGVHSYTWAWLDSKDITKQYELKRKYNVLFIDEVSMMTEPMKQRIIKNYTNQKIIFAGDVGFQLPPFEDARSELYEFDINKNIDYIVNFTKSYRFIEGDLINDILENLRQCITNKTNFKFGTFKFQKIKRKEMFEKNLYSIEDLIISPTHKEKDIYTEQYKDMKKWYVSKTNKKYSCGDIIIQENKPCASALLQHAYTIHSIQGETTKNKLFIDMTKMRSLRMLYTALSRCKAISQVYLVYP